MKNATMTLCEAVNSAKACLEFSQQVLEGVCGGNGRTMTTPVKKGMRFVTRFGSEYQVMRVMPKSGKATVMRMKSGSTSNWPISEVESQLVKEAV